MIGKSVVIWILKEWSCLIMREDTKHMVINKVSQISFIQFFSIHFQKVAV